jgi:hypothetical protein
MSISNDVNLYVLIYLQAYAAEVGTERAEEPMEEAGMSEDIIQKVGTENMKNSGLYIGVNNC